MSYSLCRFWAYDESKKFLGAGPGAPAWKLALAGSMGAFLALPLFRIVLMCTCSGWNIGAGGQPWGDRDGTHAGRLCEGS